MYILQKGIGVIRFLSRINALHQKLRSLVVLLCESIRNDFFLLVFNLCYDLSLPGPGPAALLAELPTKTQSSSKLVVGGVFSVSPFCSFWAFLISCN